MGPRSTNQWARAPRVRSSLFSHARTAPAGRQNSCPARETLAQSTLVSPLPIPFLPWFPAASPHPLLLQLAISRRRLPRLCPPSRRLSCTASGRSRKGRLRWGGRRRCTSAPGGERRRAGRAAHGEDGDAAAPGRGRRSDGGFGLGSVSLRRR